MRYIDADALMKGFFEQFCSCEGKETCEILCDVYIPTIREFLQNFPTVDIHQNADGMNDYIKREDAIRAVDERIKELSKDRVFRRKQLTDVIDLLGVKKYISEIPTADVTERVRWINVNYALPKGGALVMVYGLDKKEKSDAMDFCFYSERKGFGTHLQVMYWMYLPETPKGDS
ncbi:MAG: hypothetical protein IJK23_09850 [Clostridia bacterium]|nr:hypothetical protein [Clostridia bacterium]